MHERKMAGWKNEDCRQALHLAVCLFSMAMVAFLGVQPSAYIVGAVLLAGLCLVHLKLVRRSIGPLEKLVDRFERPGVTPGYGAMTIAAGTLAIMTLIAKPEQILASLIVLGAGDSISNVVGRRGSHKLQHNHEKTYEGSLAFFLSSLPSALFAGIPAVIVAALAATAESLHTNVDDNLLIAIVCVVGFRLLGA